MLKGFIFKEIDIGENMVQGIVFTVTAVICLALMIAFLVVRIKRGANDLSVCLKTMASLVFVFGALIAIYLSGLFLANILIVMGLICAMLGDVALDLKYTHVDYKKQYLNAGMVCFCLSNVFYIIAISFMFNSAQNFWLFAGGMVLVALVFAIIVFLMAKPLKLDFSGFKALTFVYSFLVSLTSFLSLGICFFVSGFAIFACGAILVLISDLVLSLMYFGGKDNSKVLCIVNHSLYYIGQLLIVAYLFFQMV